MDYIPLKTLLSTKDIKLSDYDIFNIYIEIVDIYYKNTLTYDPKTGLMLVHMLIELAKNFNDYENKYMYKALEVGDKELIELLMDYSVDVCDTMQGLTFYQITIINNYYKSVDILLKYDKYKQAINNFISKNYTTFSKCANNDTCIQRIKDGDIAIDWIFPFKPFSLIMREHNYDEMSKVLLENMKDDMDRSLYEMELSAYFFDNFTMFYPRISKYLAPRHQMNLMMHIIRSPKGTDEHMISIINDPYYYIDMEFNCSYKPKYCEHAECHNKFKCKYHPFRTTFGRPKRRENNFPDGHIMHFAQFCEENTPQFLDAQKALFALLDKRLAILTQYIPLFPPLLKLINGYT